MATMQGISGGLSGKMGSVVFRQRGGQTIASQYQPAVKNPNSDGQQNARAAFKLMSQLAAVMSPGFGTMSVTKRKTKVKGTQRNAFFQLNYPLIETSTENNSVIAKIPMERLQLTSSFRQLPQIESTEWDANSVTVVMRNISSDVTTIRCIIVEYRSDNATTSIASLKSITDIPVEDGQINYDVQGSYTTPVTVLCYGLIPTDSAISRLDLDNIHTPADEQFISAVQLDALVAAGDMTETMTVGANVSPADTSTP